MRKNSHENFPEKVESEICVCVLWVQGNPTNLPGAELPSPEQHTRNSPLLQTASAAGQLRGQRRLPAPQDRYLFCSIGVMLMVRSLSLSVRVCHFLKVKVVSQRRVHAEVKCGALLNVRVSQRDSESPATRQTDRQTDGRNSFTYLIRLGLLESFWKESEIKS